MGVRVVTLWATGDIEYPGPSDVHDNGSNSLVDLPYTSLVGTANPWASADEDNYVLYTTLGPDPDDHWACAALQVPDEVLTDENLIGVQTVYRVYFETNSPFDWGVVVTPYMYNGNDPNVSWSEGWNTSFGAAFGTPVEFGVSWFQDGPNGFYDRFLGIINSGRPYIGMAASRWHPDYYAHTRVVWAKAELYYRTNEVPARRVFPRPTRRVFPPPNTRQSGRRTGPGSIL